MRLVVGGDHAGFPLKGTVVQALRDWGHEVTDIGTHSPEPVDFPDIARDLCGRIQRGEAERGIMVCGTGVGAAITANKLGGIRATIRRRGYLVARCHWEKHPVNSPSAKDGYLFIHSTG